MGIRYHIKYFIRLFVIFIFLFIISWDSESVLLGQSTITIEDWIAGRKALWSEGITNKTAGTYHSSWIRELEFRTETDEFILDRQEYLIRFRPTLPRERRAQEELIEVSRMELELEKMDFDRKINQLILDELLLIWQTTEEQSLNEELLTILEDQKTIIEGKLGERSFNLKDLSKAEQEIRTVEEKIFEGSLKMKQWKDKSGLPEVNNMVDPEKLMVRISSGLTNQTNFLQNASRDFERKKINAEIELEKAEESRIFDFFQVRYDGPHSDILRERLSMGISLQLPYSSRNKLRQEELKLEQLLAEQVFEYEKRLDSIELVMDLEKINNLIEKRRFQKEKINDQTEEIQSLLEIGLDADDNSPELILFKKEQLLKNRLKLMRTDHAAYHQILDFLNDYILLDLSSLTTFISD